MLLAALSIRYSYRICTWHVYVSATRIYSLRGLLTHVD